MGEFIRLDRLFEEFGNHPVGLLTTPLVDESFDILFGEVLVIYESVVILLH